MNLSPDGGRYWAAASGHAVPRPFAWRWLLPTLCGPRPRAWQTIAWLSLIASAAGVAALAGDWRHALAAGLLTAGLPAARYNVTHPVLVDQPAMATAIWAAVCVEHHIWWLAILLVLVAGTMRETAPVFAALYAWNPVLLVGLVPVAIAMLVIRTGPDIPTFANDRTHQWILAHPWQAGRKYHHLLDPTLVAPWGGALAGLANLDVQLAVTLAVAYSQLLVATDTVRLYQWAAPVLVCAAVGAVPVAWLPVLVIVTVWNPLAGNGV